MSPAFKQHSRTLFSAAAAVVLGWQVAPWPSSLPAQENAPAPLIVQAQARPITPVTKREQRQYNNAHRPAQPAPQTEPVQPPQQRSAPSQTNKSEVQRELDKLYEQNGRAAPEMVDPKFSQPANGQTGGAAQAAPLPAQAPQQSYQAAPVSTPKKKGFFSKLFGSKDDGPTQPPAEPPYSPPAAIPPVAPPATLSQSSAGQGPGRPNYGQLFQQPEAATRDGALQPLPPAQSFVQQPQQQVQPPVMQAPPALLQPPTQQYQPAIEGIPTVQAPVVPADDGFEAPLFVETPGSEGAQGLPAIDFNAPLVEPDTVDLGTPGPLTPVAQPVEPADPFSDDSLFPGAASSATVAPALEADKSVAAEATPAESIPPVAEEAPVDENPYSGLTLDADPFSNPSALKTADAAPREIPVDEPEVPAETVETTPPALMVPPDAEDDASLPVADRPASEFGDPAPEAGADEPPLIVDESETIPPAARLTPAPGPGNERTRAKQEMIAARKGLRGLKGFCPVVLREDRDLVDAHSQFRVIYNSKTYYLSSSQAVSAFHSDPAKYAPAARGCDVIHQTITGEELEGSLDFAVWYKGRLYLFSSAETMDTFVSAPSSHSTLD